MLRQPISKPIRTGWHVAVILAVSSSVLFTNLGGPRLWDRDEPRNAGCAQEMLQRGDWVVPFFNAELRAHKPVLLYWLMMSAYQVLGVTEFAARFWSAVLGVGTVFLTYGIGRRLFDAHVGLWAALILATSLMFGVAGRAATPDSPLIFFATAALLVYVLAAFPGDSADLPHRSQATQSDLARRTECSEFPLVKPPGPGVSNRWVAVAIYGLMGLAVLAKGPVGAVLPTAVIGMFLLIMRLSDVAQGPARPAWQRWLVRCLRPFAPQHFFGTCWQMRPLTAIAVILAVAAPWYIWVGWRTDGEFLRVFFGEHNVGRAVQPMEGHSGGPWYYPVAILVGFFPWSVFAAPVIADVTARVRQRTVWWPGYVFSLCWIGVYVGLFSLAGTKLASYVTPCYPALALLTACFVRHWTRGIAAGWRLWPAGALVTLGLVGLAMAVAVPLAASRFLPGESRLGLLGAIPLLGAVIAGGFQYRRRFPQAAATVAVTAAALSTAMFGWAVLRVDRHQRNHLLLAMIDDASGNPRVGAFGRLEPTWVFYGGRPIAELTLDPAEAARGNGPWGPKPRPLAADFFGQGQDRFIITTDRHWERLRAALPPNATVLAKCPLFLRREWLLLIGVPPDEGSAKK
jgi:4-amino-4-deoxy-L-arabinose transferase-like glycosyltransferase